MIFPGHTAMYVAQELVVNSWIARIIFRAYGFQPHHSKQRLENILETRDAAVEIVQDAPGIPPLVLHGLKHPTFYLFFPRDRRKIRQRQIVIAFEMHALGHELLATVIVVSPLNRVLTLFLIGVALSR